MIPLPEGSLLIDLHVLSILSAFILSQDQTLHSILFIYTCFSSLNLLTEYLYPLHLILVCFFLPVYSVFIVLFACTSIVYRQKLY